MQCINVKASVCHVKMCSVHGEQSLFKGERDCTKMALLSERVSVFQHPSHLTHSRTCYPDLRAIGQTTVIYTV